MSNEASTQNADIITVARALTTDAKIFGWSSPDGGTVIQLWWLASSQEIQLRELSGPKAAEFALYQGDEDGLAAARAEARLRAEIIRFNQIGA